MPRRTKNTTRRGLSRRISSSTAFNSATVAVRLAVDAHEEVVAAQSAERRPAADLDFLQQDALQALGNLLVDAVVVAQFAGAELEDRCRSCV